MHSQRLSDAVCAQEFSYTDDNSVRSVPPKLCFADVQLQLANQTPFRKCHDQISVRTEPSNPCISLAQIKLNLSPLKQTCSLKVIQKDEAVATQFTSKKLLQVLSAKVLEGEQKINHQWKTMMKCDKYLRLLCAFLKTYRAYNPKTHLSKVYKQLILARRVIRWEGKYDNLIELLSQNVSTPMKLFKIFQIIGDLVDLTGFWVKTCSGSKSQKLIDNLQQIESNFYFSQCIIWTGIYGYRYLKLRKEAGSDEKKLMEAKNKLFENAIKCIKYVMDVLTSYNNSSLQARCGQINAKLAGVITILSSIIGIFLLWR